MSIYRELRAAGWTKKMLLASRRTHEKFGKGLRETVIALMNERGLNVKEIAAEIGVPWDALYRWRHRLDIDFRVQAVDLDARRRAAEQAAALAAAAAMAEDPEQAEALASIDQAA